MVIDCNELKMRGVRDDGKRVMPFSKGRRPLQSVLVTDTGYSTSATKHANHFLKFPLMNFQLKLLVLRNPEDERGTGNLTSEVFIII